MSLKSLTATAAIAALTLATPTFAAAGDMSVAAFLAKADALEKKGAMAMFSSDLKVLKAEGTAASKAYRARLDRERAAGKPSSCPPKGTSIDSKDLLAHLRSYPVAARPTTTLRTAMAHMFIKKYPCR